MRALRTLSAMREKVRRWINDTRDLNITGSVIDTYLEDSLNTICDLLLNDNQGQRILKRTSSGTDLVVDQKDYDIPDDCLDIIGVEFSLELNSERDWSPLERAVEVYDSFPRSGNDVFAAHFSYGSPLSWCPQADEDRQIRVYPTPRTVTTEQIRFVYFHEPAFPGDDDDSFNVVDAATINTLPPGFDDLVELQAAVAIAHEEVENAKMIGYLEQWFNRKYSSFVSGRGGGATKPKRRYVEIID